MIRQLTMAVASMVAAMGMAFAQVDVNKADAAALDSVKGIGPSTSRLILEERTKGGDFKDWADFSRRIKGVGDKRAAKLSQGGLQVAGKPFDAAAPAAAGKGAPSAKPAAAAKPAPARM